LNFQKKLRCGCCVVVLCLQGLSKIFQVLPSAICSETSVLYDAVYLRKGWIASHAKYKPTRMSMTKTIFMRRNLTTKLSDGAYPLPVTGVPAILTT
jgi:hypothetical protein